MPVYWLLCGDEKIPSARIHGIRIHEELLRSGLNSHVLFKPKRYREDINFNFWFNTLLTAIIPKSAVVVIQKLKGKQSIDLVSKLRKRGVKVVFIDCDLPLKIEMARLASVVVCPSEELSRRYLEFGVGNVIFIPDAVEDSMEPMLSDKKERIVVWYGKSGLGKWDAVQWFKHEVLPRVGDVWKFVTISDHVDATIPWNLETVFQHINKSDLVVIPVSQSETDSVKSANRCTQSWALGVPVLCGELKSYFRVMELDRAGLVSNNPAEWASFMKKLEETAMLNDMKRLAFAASRKFTLSNIVIEWQAVFGNIESKRRLTLVMCLIYFFRLYDMLRVAFFRVIQKKLKE